MAEEPEAKKPKIAKAKSIEEDVQDILISEQDIQKRVCELGDTISKDYAGATQPVLLVGVLTGACVFHADLLRRVTIPVELDFMSVSSYGMGAETSGTVTFRQKMLNDCEDDPDPSKRKSVKGRDIVIIEDLIDTGTTLVAVCEYLEKKGAKSVTIAALLDKKERRLPEKGEKLRKWFKYCGFDCPNEFIIGYGIDYAERYRNLPYVASLKRSIYEKKGGH